MQNEKETSSVGTPKHYYVNRYLLELSGRVQDKLEEEIDNKIMQELDDVY